MECPSPKALSCTGYSVHSRILEGAEMRVHPSFTLALIRERKVSDHAQLSQSVSLWNHSYAIDL